MLDTVAELANERCPVLFEQALIELLEFMHALLVGEGREPTSRGQCPWWKSWRRRRMCTALSVDMSAG
jgi:hypothetical protein